MEKIDLIKVKLLLPVIFLLAVLGAGLVLVGQRYIRPRAETYPQLDFAVDPASQPLTPGKDIDVFVKVNPNGKVFSAFRLVFNINNVALSDPANAIGNLVWYPPDTTILAKDVSVTGNTVTVRGTLAAASFSGTTAVNMVKIRMKVSNTATPGNKISFQWQNGTQLGDWAWGSTPPTITGMNREFTISAARTARLYFTADKTSYNKNEDLNLDLWLDSASDNVSSYQFEFTYDSRLTFQTTGDGVNLADVNIELYDSGFNRPNAINEINPNTRFVAVRQSAGSAQISGVKKLAKIKFRVKNDATVTPATITFQAVHNSLVYKIINTEGVVQDILGTKSALSIGIEQAVVTATPTTPTGVAATPTATPTIPAGAATATPMPPSNRRDYLIDIEEPKPTLVVNIGAPTVPLITFRFRLFHVRNTPDIYVKMRVKDELAFIDNPGAASNAADTCNNPPVGEKDIYIPARAEGGIYRPVPQVNVNPPAGALIAPVSADGWVTLIGIVPNRYYTLILKGPKTRGEKMVEHFTLQTGRQTNQNFDWTAEEKALQPGDLPNPNQARLQDCVVNSIDWSLIQNRIAATDQTALDVADVNYDGMVNAGDVVEVVHTLSTKPDDEL